MAAVETCVEEASSSSHVPERAPTSGKSAALKESMKQLLRKKGNDRHTSGPVQQREEPTLCKNDPHASSSGYPASSSTQSPILESASTAAQDNGNKSEALKSSMKKLLLAKASKKAGAEDTSTATIAEDCDPWPELPLSHTVLGISDGRERAAELVRRLDYDSASRMWSKVLYIANKCKPPLSAEAIAELENSCKEFKQNMPAPPEPSSVTQGTESSAKKDGQSQSKVPKDIGDDGFNAGDWNQAFFDRMENDYNSLCASDGWDDLRKDQGDLLNPSYSSKSPAVPGNIPMDSDYFKVKLPVGSSDRELRCQETKTVAPENNKPSQKLSRNLEELRRVELATQAAMDEEKARRAANNRPPIRTKSDVVYLDSLSDDSHSEKGDDSLPEDVEATFRAFAEFEQLGKEREERLAKWRERWG